MTPLVVSFVGASGSGKSTLLCQLVPALRARGLKVAAIKHSSHRHPLDRPGSDSQALAASGAEPSGFATPEGVALIYPGDPDVLLPPLLRALPVDVVLVEGWKQGPFPKIEVWRADLGPSLASTGLEVRAMVTRDPAPQGVRVFNPDELNPLSDFLVAAMQGQLD